jgi:hypothetical protein
MWSSTRRRHTEYFCIFTTHKPVQRSLIEQVRMTPGLFLCAFIEHMFKNNKNRVKYLKSTKFFNEKILYRDCNPSENTV